MQDLKSQELAAVLSSIIASEFNHRPNMFVGYGCSDATLEAIEAMEPDREWLYNLQVRAGIDAPLGVDIRLSGRILSCSSTMAKSIYSDLTRFLSTALHLVRKSEEAGPWFYLNWFYGSRLSSHKHTYML